MSEEKKVLVESLLNSVGKTSPEMNQNLKMLGDGYMADGLTALWQAGQHSGIVKGATYSTVVFSLGLAAYVLIKNKVQDVRVAKQIAAYEREHGCIPTVKVVMTEEPTQANVPSAADDEDSDGAV